MTSSCVQPNPWHQLAKGIWENNGPMTTNQPLRPGDSRQRDTFSGVGHVGSSRSHKISGSEAEYQDWLLGNDRREKHSRLPTRTPLATGLDSRTPFADHLETEDDDDEDVADSFWSPENLVARTLAAGSSTGKAGPTSSTQVVSGPIDISNECVEDWKATIDERPDRIKDQLWVSDFMTYDHKTRKSDDVGIDLVTQINRQAPSHSRWKYDRLFGKSKPPLAPSDGSDELESAWAGGKGRHILPRARDDSSSTRTIQEHLRLTARTRLDLLGSHLGHDLSDLVSKQK